jgi:chemotaxis protein MotB
MRPRKNKPGDGGGAEHRWVISYADFITLLFAFFVVMYSISSVNESKYKSVSDGMHSAFNKKSKDVSEKEKASDNNQSEHPAMKSHVGDGADSFSGLGASLEAINDGDYKIHVDEGYIEINIQAGALFVKGDAEMKSEAFVKLMKIASILKESTYPVALEGYTDNLPIETPQYPSNWELSSARAAALARTLATFGVAASRLSVTGFGDQFPIADNATAEGRASNRRVNILITRNRMDPRGAKSQKKVPLPLVAPKEHTNIPEEKRP